ncbi:MAG TPA: hypothetical protein VJN72_07865 [Gaiellales bacterium]|nr:hypothetical protein [Gaiellales bacterium]
MLAAIAAFVLLGLLNTFGQRPSTSDARTAAATLVVTAPSDVRGGLIFQVRIQITARRRLAKPTLVFSPAWFESMTTNAVAPQPSTQTSINGWPAFQLSPIPAGQHATYWFYFQVNPTNVGWRRPETLQLDDGHVVIASIHRTITVYP